MLQMLNSILYQAQQSLQLNSIFFLTIIFFSFSTAVSHTEEAVKSTFSTLKGPKHDQVGCEFFYIKQPHMVR